MATIAVSVFEPALGKAQEAQTLLKEAQEIVTGLGTQVQIAALVRGGVPGQLTVMAENSDSEAYGAALDKQYADAGYQQFLARAQSSAALTPIRSVDYVEIPGCERPYADIAGAGVVMASLLIMRDGQQVVSLDRIQRWKKLVEKHGARARALQSIASDPAGLIATVAYYENFTEWGKIGNSLTADPDWQAFGAEIRGQSPSSDFLRTSLYRII